MRFRRITVFLLALVMAVMTLSGSSLADGEDYGTFGDELTEEQYDFIYNEDHYNMKFSTRGVYIVLKKGSTVVTADFSEIEYSQIVPEMYVSTNSHEDSPVLFMVIDDQTVSGVLSAIDILKDNPDVLYAEPIYSNYVVSTGYSTKGNGDINYDGNLTNTDLITMARYIVRLTSLTFNQLQRADINGDGRVNNTDLVLLAKKVVGIK